MGNITPLKLYFRKIGMPQSEIANKLGVTQGYVAAMLNGNHPFRIASATKWSKAFGFNPQWLISGEGSMFPGESPSEAHEPMAEYTNSQTVRQQSAPAAQPQAHTQAQHPSTSVMEQQLSLCAKQIDMLMRQNEMLLKQVELLTRQMEIMEGSPSK